MMLQVSCPSCGNIGHAVASRLPRALTCSMCAETRHVETKDGARIVSTAAREEWVTRFLAAARS
jgi:ribosomal protein S27E